MGRGEIVTPLEGGHLGAAGFCNGDGAVPGAGVENTDFRNPWANGSDAIGKKGLLIACDDASGDAVLAHLKPRCG